MIGLRHKSEDEAAVAKKDKKRATYWSSILYLFLSQARSYMKMRNPLKPKNKARRFAELQEDQGFSDAQFETPETPSMYSLDVYIRLHTKYYTIVPWNAIGLATLLFTVGGILLALGILIKIGTITSEVCTILWVTEKLLLSDQCMDRYGWQEEHHSLFLEVSCSSLVSDCIVSLFFLSIANRSLCQLRCLPFVHCLLCILQISWIRLLAYTRLGLITQICP